MKPIFSAKTYAVLLASILIILVSDVYGQQSKSRKKTISRSALNLTGGFNYPFTSVAGRPGVAVNFGYVFVPISWLGLSAEVSYGTMSGNGVLNRKLNPELLATEFSYSTQYTYWGIYGILNLHKIFSPRPPKSVSTYITLGSSYMRTVAERKEVNPHTYDFPMYATHIGMMFRIKTTTKMDLLISGRYYITQSYFLDGIPHDGIFDSFFSLQAGLSYKFGVDRKVDFVDWKRYKRGSSQFSRCPRFY
jgi:hypothetical protein